MTSPDRIAADLVLHAAQRSAAEVHRRMARGVNSLATIAVIAPWLGILATTDGIIGSFRGTAGEKSANMAAYFAGFADAMAFMAFALLSGVLAHFCYRYLEGELETFDAEMKSAGLQLANTLTRHHV